MRSEETVMSHNYGMTIVAAILLISSAGAAAAAGKVLPASAIAADPEAVVELFRNKTWNWTAGAAFFAPNQDFTAWSGTGRVATYAKGRWFATQHGKICFRAVWYVKIGSNQVLTCFDNRTSGGTVYQRKSPVGPWYVFKSAHPNRDDEYNKLVAGDLVSAKLRQVSSAMRRGVE
jgi:hypothetical protein